MKKITGFLFIAFYLFGQTVYSQTSGQHSLTDRTKNVYNDCASTLCNDKWISDAYYQIWGSCPAQGGTSGVCNYLLYGGGSWSSWNDLCNKVRLAYTKPRSSGKVYVFMRPVDAMGFGHMGWGIMLSDGSFYCGSTENPFAPPKPADQYKLNLWLQSAARSAQIPAGQDNSSWTMRFPTEAQMFARMKSLNYTKWKGVAVANPKIFDCKVKIEQIKGRGYDVIGNNCFDHTYDVLNYYGISWVNLPLKQTYPVPNEWFRQFYRDNSNNYYEGWNL